MAKRRIDHRVSDRVARAMKKLIKYEIDKGRMSLADLSVACGMSPAWTYHLVVKKPNGIENPRTSTAVKVLKYFGLSENLLPKRFNGRPTRRATESWSIIQPKVRITKVAQSKIGSTARRVVKKAA